MTEIQPEFMTRILALARAIDDVLAANHTLRAALKPGHPPFDGPLSAGVARYGEGPLFGLWAECRAVETLRIAWTGYAGPAAIPAELPAPDETTDEAPGLEVPTEASEGNPDQQRLPG